MDQFVQACQDTKRVHQYIASTHLNPPKDCPIWSAIYATAPRRIHPKTPFSRKPRIGKEYQAEIPQLLSLEERERQL